MTKEIIQILLQDELVFQFGGSVVVCFILCLFFADKATVVSLRSHGDKYNQFSLTNVEMAAFSSVAKYGPCACVYHNNKTPYLTKKNPKLYCPSLQ